MKMSRKEKTSRVPGKTEHKTESFSEIKAYSPAEQRAIGKHQDRLIFQRQYLTHLRISTRISDFQGKRWSQLSDLNRGPTHYKCVALPLS